MATLNQIEANRLNAQKSTGPRTFQGKAVSRFNALKSGIDSVSEIIPGEDYNELEGVSCEYHERWQPALPEERCLVDALVFDEWQLRRLRKAEAHLWCHYQAVSAGWDGTRTFAPMGMTFERGAGDFMRLQRRIDATERNYHRTLDKLQSLAAQVPGPEQPETVAPVEVTDAPPPPQPPIGFVPPTPVARASRPALAPKITPVPAAIQPNNTQPAREAAQIRSMDPKNAPVGRDGILRGGCQPPRTD